MNIENLLKLESGAVINNYKAMCVLLDEKIKTGNSKKAQLREWERFISYHKEGNKFIIDEVYEEPKEKLDLRGRDGLMSNDIQPLILDLLAHSNENTVCLSCTKLLENLKIVNQNYAIGRNNIKTFSQKIGVDEAIVFDFYQYEHNKLKLNLESALRTLQNRGLVFWNKVMMVHEKYQDDNNENNYLIRRATSDEIEFILEIQKDTLNELKIFTLSEIYASQNRINKFNKLMFEKLMDSGTHIVKAYIVYEVIYTKKHIISALEEETKKLIEEELNFKILQSTYKSIKEKHENAKEKEKRHLEKIEEWGEQDALNIKTILRTCEDYIEKSTKVCNTTIKKDTKKII